MRKLEKKILRIKKGKKGEKKKKRRERVREKQALSSRTHGDNISPREEVDMRKETSGERGSSSGGGGSGGASPNLEWRFNQTLRNVQGYARAISDLKLNPD